MGLEMPSKTMIYRISKEIWNSVIRPVSSHIRLWLQDDISFIIQAWVVLYTVI